MIIFHDEAKERYGFSWHEPCDSSGANLLAILDGFSNVIVFHFFSPERQYGKTSMGKGGWGFGMEKHW